MLVIVGTLNGIQKSLTYENGELGGDADLVEGVRELAQAWDGEAIGVEPGPFTVTAEHHLSEPLSIAFLAQRLLENSTVEGLDLGFNPNVVY